MPQRQVVHSALNPAVRSGRSLVLRYHRFFQVRKLNQYAHQPGHTQSGRHDSTAAWRETSLPLSFGADPVVPARQTATPETGRFSYLPCGGSGHSSHAVSGHGRQELTPGSTAGRGCCIYLGGVYPSSRLQLRAIGQLRVAVVSRSMPRTSKSFLLYTV